MRLHGYLTTCFSLSATRYNQQRYEENGNEDVKSLSHVVVFQHGKSLSLELPIKSRIQNLFGWRGHSGTTIFGLWNATADVADIAKAR